MSSSRAARSPQTTPRELLEKLRRDRGPIPDTLVAEALGVSRATIERWKRSSCPEESEDAAIRRLAWFASQARHWYLRVVPALLVMWRPGEYLGREEARGHRRPAGDFISRISACPQGRDLVECRLTLAADFEVLVFMTYGPDRERVRLARNIGDEGGPTLRVHTGRGWGPSYERASLGRGDEVVLYVRYLL